MTTPIAITENRLKFSSIDRARALLVAGCAALSCHGALAAPANQFDGLIEPSQTIELRTPVIGLIDKISTQRGGVVKKGAVLVSLDASVERAAAELARYKATMDGALLASDSRLAYASRKVKRRSELADKNYGTAQERDDAELEQRVGEAEAQAAKENREVARLEYAFATAQLNLKQIRSPIDGVVIEQSMWPGEMAQPGDTKPPILKLAQIDPLRVAVILPATLYSKLKLGMKAQITPEKPIDGSYAVTIAMIDRTIDAASATFRVYLTLPNPDGALPGGLKCKVTFANLP